MAITSSGPIAIVTIPLGRGGEGCVCCTCYCPQVCCHEAYFIDCLVVIHRTAAMVICLVSLERY